jgi:superfamily II DNA helicase RecQ
MINLMQEVAEVLLCPIYTGDRDVMTDEEREQALAQWESPTGSPAIAATSALSVGYNYPHVRCVIYAGPPRCLTDFSQESGRGGRDGQPADSVILIAGAPATGRPSAPSSAAWQAPPSMETRGLDEEAIQLYLIEQYCLRGVLSQFLDAPDDWRWCMEGEDELCSVCPGYHIDWRLLGLPYRLPVLLTAEEEEEEEEEGSVHAGSM